MSAWFDRILDIFGATRTVVVDEDSAELQKALDVIRNKYGKWTIIVKGFSNYREFFQEIEVAKVKKHPYKYAFLHGPNEESAELILRKADPEVKAIRYSDTQNLGKYLPALR